jgi:hypothetical protein
MHETESNDRAVKVAFGYATPGKSRDELAHKEENRWRNIAFARQGRHRRCQGADMSARHVWPEVPRP